ncbi:MAG: hypothetical protein ABIM31_02655 [candidate division WOR-3 bacterium]
MQRYVFDSKNFNICGIDENGYGPLLGPLVVTGVSMEVTGADPFSASEIQGYKFPLPLKDSKEIFRRSTASYKLGESVALSLLNILFGSPRSLTQLLSAISVEAIELKEYGIDDVELPAFGGYPNENLIRYLSVSSLRVMGVKSKIVMADLFNKLVTETDNKSLVDFICFLELVQSFNCDTYLLGKIGGLIHYNKVFQHFGIHCEIVKETFTISSYKINENRLLHFILNGDRRYLPIMFAGIIGKYLRELIMLGLSRALGYQDLIPFASGYHHDERTFLLLEKIPRDLKEKWVRIR